MTNTALGASHTTDPAPAPGEHSLMAEEDISQKITPTKIKLQL